jgi:hypothetical protein
MRKKGFSALIVFVLLIVFGCNPHENRDYYQGGADLSVINMSTGDTTNYFGGGHKVYKKGKKIMDINISVNVSLNGSIVEGQAVIPKFHPSEKMRLLFTPPSPFEDNDYRVNFQFAGIVDTIVYKLPYQIDITIGQELLGDTCSIKCSAYSPDWDESMSKCEQECSIVVE